MKKVLISIIITFFVLVPFLALSLKKSKTSSDTLAFRTRTNTVPKVTARVGEYQIRELSGWASPFAEVELNSQGTARKAAANQNGYFEFNFVPIKKSFGELCLTSIDVFRIPTLPHCLPKPPLSNNIVIKGVLLPPSLTLEAGKILSGKTAKASGMTFPNSEVDVYLFENYNSYNYYKIYNFLFPTVFAAGLPKYTIKSNQSGYFEFSLPTFSPSDNRIFTAAVFPSPSQLIPDTSTSPSAGSQLITHPHPQYYSPKSNTLSYEVFKPFSWLFILLLVPLIIISILLLKRVIPAKAGIYNKLFP